MRVAHPREPHLIEGLNRLERIFLHGPIDARRI
jgi:hypothetical protein